MNMILDNLQQDILKWLGVTAEHHRLGRIKFRINKENLDRYT